MTNNKEQFGKEEERQYYLTLSLGCAHGLLKALKGIAPHLCDDKELVLNVLNVNGLAMEYVSERLRRDWDVITVAIKENSGAMRFVDKELRGELGFWKKIIETQGDELYGFSEFISQKLLQNKEDFKQLFVFFEADRFVNLYRVNPMVLEDLSLCEKILKKHVDRIRVLPEAVRSNKEFIKKFDEKILRYYNCFAGAAREDEGLFFNAIKLNKNNFNNASESLKQDKEVIKKALEYNWLIYSNLSLELKEDKEIILKMIKESDGSGTLDLNFTSGLKELFKDKEFALSCVKKDGEALEKFEQFQDDEEVVSAAINETGSAYMFASKRLKLKKDIALIAVKKSAHIFKEFPKELQKDVQLCEIALKSAGWILEHCSDEMKANKKIVNTALNYSGSMIRFVCPSIINDEDIALIGMSEENFHYFSDEVRSGIIEMQIKNQNGQINYKESLRQFFERKKALECKALLERIDCNVDGRDESKAPSISHQYGVKAQTLECSLGGTFGELGANEALGVEQVPEYKKAKIRL